MPISLGSITFGFGADTTMLRRSISDITNFGTQVEAVAASAATAGTRIETAFRQQERAMIGALQQVQKYNDKVNSLRAPENLTRGLQQLSTRTLENFTQRMSMGQLSAIQFQREMERFGQGMTNATRIMNQWSAAQKQAQMDSLVGSLQKLSSAAVLVYGPLSGVATRISVLAGLAEHFSLAWAGAIAGVASGAVAFLKLSEAIINTERQLSNIGNTLQAVYGNVTIANLQLSYLTDLSNKTGVSFATLARQFSQVQAAAKGTSLEGERINKVFESIAFAGTKLGLNNEELEGSFRAIQQMVSKGTIQMEELKGQLGDRLPGAVQVMAQALGVSTLKLNDMIKKGEVGASALTKFADALLKRYNIDTSAKIDTIAAAEGRLATARMAAIDSLDRIIGVSSAYKNVINTITDGLNGASSRSAELVKWVVQLGAAFAAAFAAPLIQGGLTAMIGGITALARTIATLSTASALASLTSFGKVLTTLAIATAAYYGSAKLMDQVMGDTQQSFMKAKPAVEDYINAQKTLITSVRQPTRDYIKEQEDLLAAQEKQRDQLIQQGQAIESWQSTMESAGMSAKAMQDQFDSMGGPETVTRLQAVNNAIAKTKANIASLTDILKRQNAEEDKQRKDPTKDLSTRQESTLKKAQEDIRDIKAKYDALFLSPAAKEYAQTQEEINHAIEQFKINLERAEIPAGQIKDLVKQYGDAIRNLKEGEQVLKNQKSAFQAIADIFDRGMNNALTNFTDAIVDGKDAMQSMTDVAKAVVKDIINTFMKLAVLAPLKNALFGTNDQVLGGNAGLGGAIGNLFGLGNGTAATVTNGGYSYGGVTVPVAGVNFANGGIMTQYGSIPLRRYASGGIASSPQMAMYGEGHMAEAYVPLPDGRRIPVNMQGQGGGGQEVHIHPPAGYETRQESKSNNRGGTSLHVEFVRAARAALMDDISQGGPISRSMERQYGMNRAKGLA